jgi:glycosyltransferase involved in cell wall biosynthesis
VEISDAHIDVSIVVAAHNEEQLLPRCLESLSQLAGPERVEIIVVDNASSDRTVEVARSFGARVVSEKQLGAVHAKAAGVRAARGAIVAILDADSSCAPDWVSRIHDAFEIDRDLVGLSGPARYISGRFWGPLVVWWWYLWWHFVSFFVGAAVYAVGTNVAFRRDAYRRSEGFDTGVLVGGDEMALFSALRKVGRTRFDLSLSVDTDGRRTNMGFLRFVWEIVLIEYLINYPIYRLTGRSLRRSYQPGSTLR